MDKEDKSYHRLATYPTDENGHIRWQYDEDNEVYEYIDPATLTKYRQDISYETITKDDQIKT